MNALPEIFFHLGLPKTGSTYLQHLVFPYLEGIRYFPKKHYKHFEQRISENAGTKKFLFSVEEDKNLRKRMEILARYRSDIRIILVFRRHDSWLASKYKYFIRKHGYASYEEFLTLKQHPNGVGGYEGLFYRPKIEWAEELFEQPPLVLIFEELKKSPEAFLTPFLDFTGTTLANHAPIKRRLKTAMTEKQLKWVRRYNKRIKYQKKNASSKVWNKIHLKTNQLGLHTVANLARVAPKLWTENEVIIPDGALTKIRQDYKADWQYCLDYAGKQR